jgi:hypothetical protein
MWHAQFIFRQISIKKNKIAIYFMLKKYKITIFLFFIFNTRPRERDFVERTEISYKLVYRKFHTIHI